MVIYKVAFVGESGVGKTSLIKAFIGEDIKKVKTTIGVDFYTFTLGDDQVVVWDFAGQEWFRSVIVEFLKGAALVVMVFDLSRMNTLLKLVNEWADHVLEISGKDTIVIVVGNKSDIKKIDDSVIMEVIDSLKRKLNVKLYLQTSALKNEGVSNLFQAIFDYVKMVHAISRLKDK